jgi:protein tyrosine phosphatase (PTP) superfamily phosphohydrolase (DUF442 family)
MDTRPDSPAACQGSDDTGMDIRKIDTGLTVSPQIAAADLAIVKIGFSRDHLQPPRRRRHDQPTFEEIEAAR